MFRAASRISALLVMAVLLVTNPAAGAAAAGTTVMVKVSGVRDDRGHVLVALCPMSDFLTEHCPYHASAPARAGDVLVQVDDVPPGRYAAQAFHDDNDTGKLEHSFFSLPRKGMGFSRDARMHFGPPRFNDAAFDVGSTPVGTYLTLRYP